MALDGIMFEGVTVRVRRPNDYNPAAAAALGPSVPNQALNLGAIGLQPGAGMVRGSTAHLSSMCLQVWLPTFLPPQGRWQSQSCDHRPHDGCCLAHAYRSVQRLPAGQGSVALFHAAPSKAALLGCCSTLQAVLLCSCGKTHTMQRLCGQLAHISGSVMLLDRWLLVAAAGHGRRGRPGVCGRAALLPGRRPVPRAAVLLRAPQVLRPCARPGDRQLQGVRAPALAIQQHDSRRQ